jgi:hypothetical protein
MWARLSASSNGENSALASAFAARKSVAGFRTKAGVPV